MSPTDPEAFACTCGHGRAHHRDYVGNCGFHRCQCLQFASRPASPPAAPNWREIVSVIVCEAVEVQDGYRVPKSVIEQAEQYLDGAAAPAVRAPQEPAVHKLSAEAAARVGKALEFMASEYKRVGYVQRDDDDPTRTALRAPGEGTPHVSTRNAGMLRYDVETGTYVAKHTIMTAGRTEDEAMVALASAVRLTAKCWPPRDVVKGSDDGAVQQVRRGEVDGAAVPDLRELEQPPDAGEFGPPATGDPDRPSSAERAAADQQNAPSQAFEGPVGRPSCAPGLDLLIRLLAWDGFDVAADGPYWKAEITATLRAPGER